MPSKKQQLGNPLNNDIAIKVEHISKSFRIPQQRRNTIRERILSFHKKMNFETFNALEDVSFEIRRGEFFGIIGRNGSGKSTLLKILAGIYTPDSGSVQVNGEISPFLELGVGFNPELSGKDNIYLNGTILGLTKKEIERKYNTIVEFSELERFIHLKLKNYSSGMQVRLAFSVAVHANKDILIMDEVLAVGDSNFANKCLKEFNRYREDGKTIILVTHDLASVQRYCDRIMLLRNGVKVNLSDPDEVISEYTHQNMSDEEKRILVEKKKNEESVELKSAGVKLESVEFIKNEKIAEISNVVFIDANSTIKNTFNTGEDIIARIFFNAHQRLEKPVFGVAIYTSDGIHLSGPNTKTSNFSIDWIYGEGYVDFIIKNNGFVTGTYKFTAALYDWECIIPYDIKDKSYEFNIFSEEVNQYGLIRLNHSFKIKN